MQNETLIIIPARGGSKGVPRKNVRAIGGKPLIVHTIEAALQANINSRVMVTTEDEEIADVAQKAGAEIPFMRPVHLAQDDTTSLAVVEYVISRLEETEKYSPMYIMLLQPTSPFRDSNDIENAMNIMLKQDCDSVISVTEVREHPYIMYGVTEAGMLHPYADNPYKLTRRQDFPPIYRINGAIYITKKVSWEKYKSFNHVPNIFPYLMSGEKSIDIDHPMDWSIAELYFNKNYGN